MKGDEYDLIIPQARIVREDRDGINKEWKADFVLHPFDQTNFCKVLELKLPEVRLVRPEKGGHPQFYITLLNAIRQLQDYARAFHSTVTRDRFKDQYKIDVYEPDMQLIVGRKWDIDHINKMLETQRINMVSIDDWDTAIARMRRKFT